MSLKLITTASDLIQERDKNPNQVGFVPTMGNLHQGHLSLLSSALENFNTVYFSIFVNPTQFGPNEDFKNYPRTLEQDLKLIEQMLTQYPDKKVIVFAPKSIEEIYPSDFKLVISLKGITDELEGKFRPGHFDGVCTVVYRLFSLIRPQKAYFGLKDYQQLIVIKKMTLDMRLPIEIIGMPIIRDNDGLALSSRNQYLSHEERQKALVLPHALNQLQNQSVIEMKKNIQKYLQDSSWDYLELRDAQTLSPYIERSSSVVLLGVYRLGKTRLLDNKVISWQ